jgi:hypothetical protein
MTAQVRSTKTAQRNGPVKTAPEALLSLEQLDRDLGLTAESRSAADAFLDALDRLEEEQDGEVSEAQVHVLRLVLTAARYVRNEAPFNSLAAETGADVADLRAAAVALRTVGLGN